MLKQSLPTIHVQVSLNRLNMHLGLHISLSVGLFPPRLSAAGTAW